MSKNKKNVPYVIFDALTLEPDGKGGLQEVRKDITIRLDTSFGTAQHFQRYALKKGWLYKSHDNLNSEDPNHRDILGYISVINNNISAHAPKLGIAAKAEARAKAKEGSGE